MTRRALLIGIPVVVVAIALGVAAAFGVSRLINNSTTGSGTAGVSQPTGTTNLPAVPRQNGRNNGNGRGGFGAPNGGGTGPGSNWGWFGYFGMGPGMMQPGTPRTGQQPSGQRITIDQAIQDAQNYAAKVGNTLTVADVLEFQNGFYAIVTEQSTGRGAFELLIDPDTGNVSREMSPDMMWNLKYGRMRANGSGDNTVTLQQAQTDAQKVLDARGSGATLGNDAFDFYGFYTFNYQVNGQTAGLLSVNGINGQVWLDARLGNFIAEKEVGK